MGKSKKVLDPRSGNMYKQNQTRGETEMTTVYARHVSDDLEVVYSATQTRSDNGIRGYEVDDVDIIEVHILGHEVDIRNLPKALVDELYKLSDDIDDFDWEPYV